MPVILRYNGYRFWFYEADLDEPPHVHVGKDGKEAKFWLRSIAVARKGRFRPIEIREIERILINFQADILAAWQKELLKRGNC
jgi:hypothetical protein